MYYQNLMNYAGIDLLSSKITIATHALRQNHRWHDNGPQTGATV
jgi:hypothetical protein